MQATTKNHSPVATHPQPDQPGGWQTSNTLQAGGLVLAVVVACIGFATWRRGAHAERRAREKHDWEHRDRQKAEQKAATEKRAREIELLAGEANTVELTNALDIAAAALLVAEGKGTVNGRLYTPGAEMPEVEASTDNIFRRRRHR